MGALRPVGSDQPGWWPARAGHRHPGSLEGELKLVEVTWVSVCPLDAHFPPPPTATLVSPPGCAPRARTLSHWPHLSSSRESSISGLFRPVDFQ